MTDLVLVFMTKGGIYSVADSNEFTPDHPFQLMPESQAKLLTAEIPDRFRYATPEELKAYYGVENI